MIIEQKQYVYLTNVAGALGGLGLHQCPHNSLIISTNIGSAIKYKLFHFCCVIFFYFLNF